MLKNRVFYVLLLAAAAFMYIFTNTYYTLTVLLLCIALPMLSLLLMLLAGRGLAIELEVPPTAGKKDAELTYVLGNSSRMPVAKAVFRVQLENRMTGTFSERIVNATVGGSDTVTARLSLRNSKVGTVAIATKKIRVYDAFGLFAFKKADLEEREMIIYPDMRDVTVHMARPVETSAGGSRYAPDRAGNDVSEIFTLREYAAGDEIRKIHWKLSSKMDRTMVRDFSLPLNYSVFLLLELTHGSEELVDAQVETYLALSRALLENGINHNIGWYDAGEEAFHVRELDDFEQLEMASAQVLSSYAAQNGKSALEYYAAGGYRSRQSILIYVVTAPETDKIAELEVSQRMQTILIYDDEAVCEAARQAIDVMAVSVEEAERGLPEIII